MGRTFTILDPDLGARARWVVSTIFAIYVLAEQTFGFAGEPWAGWVTKIAAFLIAAINLLARGTTIGNIDT